eukprot:GHVU01231607.1.p3 GENE.GHVU01231607.1~~GHVU01231607.1.p3  ORF type:complete len:101 (-),score=3.93 GHVU01231607.1:1157-1459(-)
MHVKKKTQHVGGRRQISVTVNAGSTTNSHSPRSRSAEAAILEFMHKWPAHFAGAGITLPRVLEKIVREKAQSVVRGCYLPVIFCRPKSPTIPPPGQMNLG